MQKEWQAEWSDQITVKVLKIQTTEKLAVIIIKFEQDGFTVE